MPAPRLPRSARGTHQQEPGQGDADQVPASQLTAPTARQFREDEQALPDDGQHDEPVTYCGHR